MAYFGWDLAKAVGEPVSWGCTPSPRRVKTDAMENYKVNMDHPDLSQESGRSQNPSSSARPDDRRVVSSNLNVAESSDFDCPLCGRSFKTKTGLGVHKGRPTPQRQMWRLLRNG
ncbi:unnamed protein product, partial [Brenthis ino]